MSKNCFRNRRSGGSHPGLSAMHITLVLLVLAVGATFVRSNGGGTLHADDENKVEGVEDNLAPSDHAGHDDSAARIPQDAAGQRAELLRMAKLCDLDILRFGQADQEKREAEINTFVAAALDGDYSKAGDFEEIMEEIRKARLDNDNAMFCHCGKNLNSDGYCAKCTPKPNKLRDE